jgi:uncharacterized protein
MTLVDFRVWCRRWHRDLGYLITGLTLVYAVSGIALNHRNDWNPSYRLERREVPLPAPGPELPLSRAGAGQLLAAAGVKGAYLNHYAPAPGQVRIFFQGGNVTLEAGRQLLVVESLHRRPLLHAFNALHYNPGRWWTWVADIYSALLLVVALTGLFILRGRHGITRRGGILVAAGCVLPGIFVFLYL